MERPARTGLVAVALACLVQGHAGAHVRLKPDGTLKPRSEDSGIKTGPCGDDGPTADDDARTVLQAGDDLTVEWEETVQHPGYFRIAFSEDGDDGFDDNVLVEKIEDTQDGPVSSGNPSSYHQYTKKIKVPDVECERCAIQLIQYMTERNPPSKYFSCADVKIVKDAAVKGAPKNVKITVKRKGTP